jgi:isocitrate/isopropylmalate dehydrogenase
LEAEAACIENAVSTVLNQGSRTTDLVGSEQNAAGRNPVSTSEMGNQVVEAVRKSAAVAKRKPA